METKNKIRRILDSLPKDLTQFASRNLDIVMETMKVLSSNNKKPSDLAKELNKSESEISKWFTGTQNFTLKTLVKIENTIGSRLIYTVPEAEKEFGGKIKRLENQNERLRAKLEALKFEVQSLKSEQNTFSYLEFQQRGVPSMDIFAVKMEGVESRVNPQVMKKLKTQSYALKETFDYELAVNQNG